MPELAIVLGFRNRDLERVARCLGSLTAQTFQDFEVIVVDYGSDPAVAASVQAIVEQHPSCRYIYSDSRGQPWNRARALNIGARAAHATYLMTTDADMIFSPIFLATLMEEANENRVLYASPAYLPRGFDDWDHVTAHASILPKATQAGMGGCQCAALPRLCQIRGFDENYEYWGLEDRDIHHRLLKLGLDEKWMNDQTAMYHQWHPPVDVKTQGLMPDGQWARMQAYFYRNAERIVRNGPDWGRIYTSADRPVLRFLDFENSRLVQSDKLVVFDGRVDNNRATGDFVRQFWELPSGYALAISGANLPQRRAWLDKALGGINRALNLLHTQARVGYAPNLLHAHLAEFIAQNQEVVLDYYLGFPAQNGISILVKA